MANNVIFKFGTKAQYDAPETKDSSTLYWLYDVLEIWKGDVCYGTGKEATALAAGLMSADDKAKLDGLVSGGTAANLTAVDGSVVLTESEEGTGIGVQLSSAEGNAAEIKEDGLFVPAAVILQSSTVGTVEVADQPYAGAQVGDTYLKLVTNDPNSTELYIPASSLGGEGSVDYTAGDGIGVVDNTISVEIDPEQSNGLVASGSGLGLALATAACAGAMSAVDKAVLDAIPSTYATQEDMAAVQASISALEQSCAWEEM